MRRLLFGAVIVGFGWLALAPAMATSVVLPDFNGHTIMGAQLKKPAIGSASTGVMATLPPMPIIRRRTATIRLPPHTPIPHLFMATNRARLRTPTLHPYMAMRHLLLRPTEPIHPRKATTATTRPQREPIHREMTSTASIQKMDLRAWS